MHFGSRRPRPAGWTPDEMPRNWLILIRSYDDNVEVVTVQVGPHGRFRAKEGRRYFRWL